MVLVMKEKILGYEVDTLLVSECARSIINGLGGAQACKWLACINPHSYAVALEDAKFRDALKDADWLIPDGVGVVFASRLLGGDIRQRVSGPDLFFELHEGLNRVGGVRVFFLGGTGETLIQIQKRMAVDYPNIELVGVYSPPFKENYSSDEMEEMISAVNDTNADILWVGLTAPKQEKWIYENKSKLNVRFVGAIGAVFDFYAGTVKRSPLIFRKLGLEWLPRLVQQPRRLWRRMFVSAPIFVWHVLKFRLNI